MDSARVAIAGADLRRVPMGRLLWPDALAMPLHSCLAHSWVRFMLALFRELKDRLFGSHGHLAFLDHRPCSPTAVDRLFIVSCRIAAGVPREHAQSTLVLLVATAICFMGELSRVIFSWAFAAGSVYLLFPF